MVICVCACVHVCVYVTPCWSLDPQLAYHNILLTTDGISIVYKII